MKDFFVKRRISRKILEYFFKPRFHFNRIQFDLITIFLISFGIFLSFFIVASDILPKIFAASSWMQTDWSGGIGSSTANQYSSGSNIDATTAAGQITLTNSEKFTNTGFETNLTGWNSGAQPDAISGLQLWLKADAITGKNDGDTVQTWTDSSGTSTAVVQNTVSKQATYKTNVLNGQPVLRFNGSSNQYSVTLGTSIADNSYTLFAVHAPSNGTQYGMILTSNTAADDEYLDMNGNGNGKMWTYLGKWFNGGYSYTTGTALISSAVSSTTYTPYSNGTAQATTGTIPSTTSQNLVLGNWKSGNYYYIGDIAEVIMFNAVLSTADRSRIENYLRDKYNIVVSSGITSVTRDTTTKYAGSASVKLITSASDTGDYTQSINVGDTNSYNLSAYAYIDGTTAVDGTYAVLYANGSTVTTTYTSVGAGWYKMSGTVTGVASSVQYGVQIAAGKTVYLDNFSLNRFQSPAVLTSNIYDTGVGEAWGNLTYTVTTPTNTTVTVKVRAGNNADLSDATAFTSCSAVTSGTDLTGGCSPDNKRYVQYQVTLSTTNTTVTPTFSDVTINFSPYDSTPPDNNASVILMSTSPTGRSISSNNWNNSTGPYFSWTAGADNNGGSGLLGYCLYLGTDPAGLPDQSKGILGTTPVPIPSAGPGKTCGFIVSSTSVDLSIAGYLGSSLSSGTTYYLNIKAIDNAANVYTGASTSFHFQHDSNFPTNVGFLTMPSQNFSNVADMNFAWPTSGGSASSDGAGESGVLGWQYQINSTTGTWQGTTHEPTLNLDYIPATASAYVLVPSRDTSSISPGNNIVYFRTVDNAGNTSSPSTYRTGNLIYGGAAPTFPGNGTVTITPSVATTNSFALSWPSATAITGHSVTHYYYMINNSPPSSLSTLQGNSGKYIDNGTSTSVAAGALANVSKGTNTVYVVAIDDASTPNYSPSNYIQGTFTLNSTDPDPVQNLVATDSSIKSQSQWNVTLTWTAGTYQGAGNLIYNVYRSTDDSSFSEVGSTSGLSYVDNTPSSTLYYYYIVTKDGASATSSNSTTVSITPTGKYTSPPNLQSGPTAGSITTQAVTITWSTDRDGDSKIAYGTTSGSYNTTEPYVSDQVTSHSVTIDNLSPGTTYYYKVYWTDTDGNTGSSSEGSFTTSPPPRVQDVTVGSIGLSSGLITFTANGASSVKVYYGTTTGFGSVISLSTATSQTTYTQLLSDLQDGTKYYFEINGLDSSGSEYQGTILDFTTLPRPKITTVQLAQVAGTAQPTVLVSWVTNTEISSIVTYYPLGNPGASRDNINVALTQGNHQMLLSGLDPKTTYQMTIKGRDKVGNEAVSDTQTFTTATDTRPPYISSLTIEGSTLPSGGSTGQAQVAQLVVTWDTDKASTSQVEYGEGTGNSYSQKTQQDGNFTFNHLVIISGLTPSKVYHMKALSVDKYTNLGQSIDTVTITPKATDNALNLVISNLQQAFGFLGVVNSGGGQ